MKTINFIFVIIMAILIAGNAYSAMEYKYLVDDSDTIRIRTQDDSELIIVMPDMSNLKNLEREISTIMKSVDKIIDNFSNLDTVVSVSVDEVERKIIIDGHKDGEVKKMDINIDTPRREARARQKKLHAYIVFNLGFNNYLENGSFPNDNKEQYSVKAWGSWDVGIGAGMRWYVAKPLSIDIEANVSWYNFKFQDRGTRVDMIDNQIVFSSDSLGYDNSLSKITVPYVNASFVPMVHFGKNSLTGLNRNMFRIGAGVYGGYRIGGHVKYEFGNDNIKSVYKNRDDYYLNSYRYGLKAVFGINEVNIYAAYDLNTLFVQDKAPELNPISFGIEWKF